MPFSRLYLGSHSVNQVLFGLSIGFILLILYKFIYQKILYELYWYFINYKKDIIKISIIIIFHIIIIIIPIIIYNN
jgi:membrane-associated phospholipid phosphatase